MDELRSSCYFGPVSPSLVHSEFTGRVGLSIADRLPFAYAERNPRAYVMEFVPVSEALQAVATKGASARG
jgi:hypothetical protein